MYCELRRVESSSKSTSNGRDKLVYQLAKVLLYDALTTVLSDADRI